MNDDNAYALVDDFQSLTCSSSERRSTSAFEVVHQMNRRDRPVPAPRTLSSRLSRYGSLSSLNQGSAQSNESPYRIYESSTNESLSSTNAPPSSSSSLTLPHQRGRGHRGRNSTRDGNHFSRDRNNYNRSENRFPRGGSSYNQNENRFPRGRSSYNQSENRFSRGRSSYNQSENRFPRGRSSYNQSENRFSQDRNHSNQNQSISPEVGSSSHRGRTNARFQNNRRPPFRRSASHDRSQSTVNRDGSSSQHEPHYHRTSRVQHRAEHESSSPSHSRHITPSRNFDQSQMQDNFPIKEYKIFPIGYKRLQEILEDESLENFNIALRLSTESSGFALLLDSNMHGGFIQLILKLLKRLCSDDDPTVYLNTLLVLLLEKNFHMKILVFLPECFNSSRMNKQNASTHVSNTLWLMRAWLMHTPNNGAIYAVDVLLPYVKSVVAAHLLSPHEDIEVLLKETEELHEKLKKPAKQKFDPNLLALMHEEAPPDDFRQISVFPTKDDIHEKNPFVRTNLTNSAYQSVDHYLDVQFRLLREDFVRPLREGISQYFQNTGRGKKRFDGVKIYNDVVIRFPKLSHKGVTYRLQFNVDKLKFIQWRSSKRLLFGNLICLSADNFRKNFLFASITEREVELLSEGFIEVEFWKCDADDDQNEDVDADGNESDEEVDEEFVQLRQHREAVDSSSLVSSSDMKKTYAMAESEAYFEAYRHVLAGLQQTRVIPLQQYIVECRRVRDSPRYLRGLGRVATYDFSCIINDEGTSSRNHVYDVLDVNNWPSAVLLGLDPSQVGALQSALTNELSIIQGPPGTGKTFVGLKIMKMLLHNQSSNSNQDATRGFVTPHFQNVPNDPILVVCYTNHALDQFLEGIAKFHPEGLVRVGGRGKNENLKKYSLQTLRRNVETSKFSRKTYFNLRSDLEQQTAEVEKIQAILKASSDSILLLSVLESVISPEHYQQLEALNEKDEQALLSWLGVSKKVYSVPESSFIVEEPLEALVRHYGQYGFARNRVLHAIACTEQISPEETFNCLQEHDHHDISEPLINPDIVCRHLDFLPFPESLAPLLQKGFDELEIKAACFVFMFRDINDVPPPMVAAWINQKRAASLENEKEEKEEGASLDLDEEADLIEDQRMLDEDLFIHVEKRNRKGRPQLPTKNVSSAKHDELFFSAEPDGLDDGFEYSRFDKKKRRKNLIKRMKREMTRQDTMTLAEVDGIHDIFSLASTDKWKLYRYWVKTLLARLRIILNKRATKYNRLVKAMTDLRNRESFEVLKSATVIAMTTTGAAKYRDMIYKLPVRIMIVEEAAEVLEAHIVTSMPQTTQHLILIGDHQQLKPSPTVYDLAQKYNLDISLFERMVKNELPCSRLELQHRMRPRIADLIRPHIYKMLRDHQSVNLYEDVDGIQSNVFFLSHDHLEDNVMDSKSKVNQHEADFMVGLCHYLLMQGYEPEQITILTAYVGQLFAFKKAVAKKLSSRVRITAVDNFQGEENDIILLSLVRSNEEGKIGFLSIENRVCVALSRAKKGLYCIGNFELLRAKSDLWRNILQGLDRDNLLGDSMSLQCKLHKTVTKVKCQKDFEKVPAGGCGQPCQARLDCGHVCVRLCHPDDMEHKKVNCRKTTEKTCPRGHKTRTMCYMPLRCTQKYHALIPKCGHLTEIKCSKEPDTAVCSEPCEKTLRCGHKCTNVCGMSCATVCKAEVETELRCKHMVKVQCSKKDIINESGCTARCNEVLKCGHVCKGTCGRCKQGRLHVGCNNQRCGRVLCCGHLCQDTCTSVCPPCQRKCETRCQHSHCTKSCSIPCTLCKEKCNWKCEHHKCTMLCSEPCNRPPCNRPCKKTLRCKHPCIGLCGEPCPDLCRICDKEKVEEIFFGDEDEEDARFVQLECNHIFTYQGLDTWMNQENNNESSDSDIKLKECPRCKTPIRRSTRYGNVVNKTLIMINQVREKISGLPEEIEANRSSLMDAFDADQNTLKLYPLEMKKLTDSLKQASSNPDLTFLELKYNCLSELTEISELAEKEDLKSEIYHQIKLRMREVVSWLMMNRYYLSEQANQDLSQERQRLKDMLKLMQLNGKLQKMPEQRENERILKYTNRIKKITVKDVFPYSSSKQERVEDAFKKLKKLTPRLIPGLGITDNERNMILTAINLSPGHWYKCKNGHVYLIGECGGAMEESKCPECKEDIGGSSHTLNPTNSIASEMDGATRSIWDPNNLNIPDDVLRWRDG